MLQRLMRPWLASVAIFIVFMTFWHFATSGGPWWIDAVDPEYARLAGQSAATQQNAAIPTPGASRCVAGNC